jgi:hypothetical protein
VFSSILVFGSLACGDDKDRNVGPGETPQVTLMSMALTLDNSTPAIGEFVTGTLVGTYSDGTLKPITANVTWVSSIPSILEPVADQPGKFLAKTEGVSLISASQGAVRTMANTTVGPIKVTGVEILPSTRKVGIGGQFKVNVVATYSDGSRDTVTDNKDNEPQVEWSSSNLGVLVPSSTDSGFLVAFGMGPAQITATFQGQTFTGDYEVTAKRIEYIILGPQNARITAANPVQYTATGWWSDRTSTDVTNMVTWTSSDPAVAVIDANGFATAVGDGSVVISARLDADVSAMTTAHTVTSACAYPDNPASGVIYGQVMPPLFWIDAMNETGAATDFELSDVFCEADTHPTIVFAISAGWCPYCPEYMAMIDSLTPDLESQGAKVVYVVIENAAGTPATNMYAQSYIAGETAPMGHSIRVGDAETAGGVATPFSRAVSALPSAFVVRTRDMKVIASQEESATYLDFSAIVRDPERSW